MSGTGGGELVGVLHGRVGYRERRFRCWSVQTRSEHELSHQPEPDGFARHETWLRVQLVALGGELRVRSASFDAKAIGVWICC